MPQADICLVLEGTYPYVYGGVSGWTHDMIRNLSHLTFHVVTILPRDEKPQLKYELPPNVVGLTPLFLQRMPEGEKLSSSVLGSLFSKLEQPLIAMTSEGATLESFESLLASFADLRDKLGSQALIESEAAWELITRMYSAHFPHSSMLDYFWSWRAVMGNLYSLIMAPIPEARCYHALSTGYAGMFAARTKLETGRPVILTEHGIYTNERRIEIALADWLDEAKSTSMTIDFTKRDLHDLWIDVFTNYSRISYAAADHIITLYGDNQKAQIADGADPAKMRVIANGIDIERFANLKITERAPDKRPTIALICRVVPIKDIKNFLNATANLIKTIPNLQAYIIGSSDEDPAYAEDCRNMVNFFGLHNNITFTGQAKIDDYFPEIDILVSCSISEAQPLVILEAGAAGIPSVVTDVGACRELVMGAENESPSLGAGGVVVPPSNSLALAKAVQKLFGDREFYDSCSKAIKARVASYYHKKQQYQCYDELYNACMQSEKVPAWRA